jgi:hypothetical protein
MNSSAEKIGMIGIFGLSRFIVLIFAQFLILLNKGIFMHKKLIYLIFLSIGFDFSHKSFGCFGAPPCPTIDAAQQAELFASIEKGEVERYDCFCKNLPPINVMKNLKWLSLGGQPIYWYPSVSDITSIAAANDLKYLDLRLGRAIVDFSPIKALKNLETLILAQTSVKDLSYITDHQQLKVLDFSYTDVPSLMPISNLMNIEQLHFAGTLVNDLAPLAHLKNLKILTIGGKQLTDLTPIEELTNLEFISIHGTLVTDLTPLKNLKKLHRLELYWNQITDLTPLIGLENLKVLCLWDEKTFNTLDKLTQLEELNLLCRNGTINLAAIRTLKNLKTLNLQFGQATGLHALAELDNLNTITFSDTWIDLSEFKKLTALKHLRKIEFWGRGRVDSPNKFDISLDTLQEILPQCIIEKHG